MIHIRGNLFDPETYVCSVPDNNGGFNTVPYDRPPDAICVTTNCMLKLHKNEQLISVMGAGIARQAAELFPQLPERLAKRIIANGHHTQIAMHNVGYAHRESVRDYNIVSLPTKTHWKLPSSLNLVHESLIELRDLADAWGWNTVVLPRPGCGLGGLDWQIHVKPLCKTILDNRFAIITPLSRENKR